MALIVGGTTVTGTQTLDATKLTGNLPAINGSSLTNLPAATFSNADTVGVFLLGLPDNNNVQPSATQGGSSVQYTNTNNNISNPIPRPSGTLRIMGYAAHSGGSVYQRIS
tara:strand:+ start:54 stop:383 length:330 start_codon:yes stop_codon:yes gene_type:complete